MGCYWVSIKNQPSKGPRKRSLVHVDSVFFNYLFLNFENFFFQFSNEMWFYQNGHCFKCSFHGNFYWVDILHFTEFLTIIRYSRRFKIDLVFVFVGLIWFYRVLPSFGEFYRVLPTFAEIRAEKETALEISLQPPPLLLPSSFFPSFSSSTSSSSRLPFFFLVFFALFFF